MLATSAFGVKAFVLQTVGIKKTLVVFNCNILIMVKLDILSHQVLKAFPGKSEGSSPNLVVVSSDETVIVVVSVSILVVMMMLLHWYFLFNQNVMIKINQHIHRTFAINAIYYSQLYLTIGRMAATRQLVKLKMTAEKTKRFHRLVHESHTQRQQIAQSISNSKQFIKDSPNSYDLQIAFPIHHTVRTIIIEFKAALKQNHYKCLEMGTKQILAIRLNLMDRLNKLFRCRQPPKFIISVDTQEFLSMRIATIKSLQSDSPFSFKQSRPHQLKDEIQSIGKMLQTLPNLNIPPAISPDEFSIDYKQDFYSLDAVSQYLFGRILADQNYSIGSKMERVSHKFNQWSKKQAMSRSNSRWLRSALNEISEDMLQDFNCSREELLQILAYCRKSVEQYFHNRHQQIQANEQNIIQPPSHQYPEEIEELAAILPDTCKQLLKLEIALTSMDIYRTLFFLGLMYRTECRIKQLEKQEKDKCVCIMKKCFASVMTQKTKVLLNFGYQEQDYDEFINHLNLDNQIII